MRKLKLQVQMTIDGFIAGPNGEMDWMQWNWDEGLKQYVAELTEPVDCIVLGRKLAEGFIPHWAAVSADANNPEVAAGKKFTETQKLVFSKTLDSSKWDNTVLATGNLAEEIAGLKATKGKDIIAYGGATFASALISQQLIDELHLFINPTAIGQGMPIFKDIKARQDFKLLKSTSFDCGIVVLHYASLRNGFQAN